jgi:lipopolysaccharide biosynthesis glycosyltransferase
MDCDMLVLDDIANLWDLRDDKYALMCVHHEHTPVEEMKFLNQTQTKYERKNWSSVMLMNNAQCTALTPDYVETATGLDLHRFKWLKDEQIGEIPGRWNHLVDYDPPLPIDQISNLHFTIGGPYFEEYKKCGYSEVWLAEYQKMIRPFG